MKTDKLKLLALSLIGLLTLSQSQAADFEPDTIYSRWIINSRMGDFRNKSATTHFKTATTERNIEWDYVPGLVAKAILMTWEYYQEEAWSAPFYNAVEDYADHIEMRLGESNIDDLNAGKIYFELYRAAKARGEDCKAATYKENVTICRNKLKYDHRRIESPLPGAGGFWHKKQYTNQMWLDGLYMGPALYAEWQGNFGLEEGETKNAQSWDDIAMQFDTIFAHTWDAKKKLNYHAWAAEPGNAASSHWADPETGRSQEFWGRGEGWFFAALVDVLEYMPKDHPARPRLINYVNLVADGLAARQDQQSGCWYQLLQYDNSLASSCGVNNYLESSASSMFTYAYFKGIRLGVLDSDTYKPVALKAYKGLIDQFVVEEPDGKIKIIQSCESAGLSSTRKGDADYYLCGQDVMINNITEGKVLGPFIMACLEFEKQK
ncbi:glycoside hydrolase family 88/105 protein [Mangrovibacterium diazotrophicum]|uniref:Unsaturated rhamnogalacturonyl hydrolase n=1 Tax=Mangrovibacterium diazotrophicum TaxID=1261403 RepID=A0A419W312_9BACT|nr:glycoside hydrolase family 88 protein [Mangrovibacterium diazotrophicum]RKD89848.1 unsaturated rhamnogalacturonyl hydrolase [Mangrovibacterium diazotrophicum]